MLNTVMVVDDSDADLLYTRLVLERSGAAREVITFDQARAALEALREPTLRVDVILLDINMPGMNGFEFLQAYEAMQRERGNGPVVVMLTSSPDPSDRERALAFASVRGYVTKPIDRESALGLERVLQSAAPGGAGGAAP